MCGMPAISKDTFTSKIFTFLLFCPENVTEVQMRRKKTETMQAENFRAPRSGFAVKTAKFSA
jgi:hypothetical protein